MSDEFTLEKLRVSDRLAAVEKSLVQFEGTMRLVNKTMEQIQKKGDQLGVEIWGNGGNGMKIEVHDLKGKSRTMNKWATVFVLALIGLAGRMVYDLFKIAG